MRSEQLSEADAEARIAGAMPSGRVSEPEEVASLVCHLLSPLSGQVNGSGVVMDGGLSWSL